MSNGRDQAAVAAARNPHEAKQLARLQVRDMDGFAAELLASIRLYADTKAGRQGMGSPVLAEVVYAGIERQIRMLTGTTLEVPTGGPWRVSQSVGTTPQPYFVEYYEGPLPEQYGARWDPNGFPTAEEAQAIANALNRLERR